MRRAWALIGAVVLFAGCPAEVDTGGVADAAADTASDATTSSDATATTATTAADANTLDANASDVTATADDAATDASVATDATMVADGDAAPSDGDATAATATMRLHVLDVGQGDAILVELPCGAMLVDTGGEETDASGASPGFDSDQALEDQLEAFFAERPDLQRTLDSVVLTHPHIDHTHGVTRLLALVAAGKLHIRNVVTNGNEGSGSGIQQQRALHDWADTAPGVERWYVLQRKTGATGLTNGVIDPFPTCDGIDPKVTALWGRIDGASPLSQSWSPDDLDNENNHSVVLRIDFGAASALLTGDLEDAGIAALLAQYAGTGLLDVDVYKVGHHGSYNGTTPGLVQAMTPRAAVISAGPFDRLGDYTAYTYGHPRWRAVSDLLGDNDSIGVSGSRPHAVDAEVATGYSDGHGVFEMRHIARAVFSTGWEHHAVVVGLRSDGLVTLPE